MSRPKLQPYPGLRAFERYESRIFFGRQQQVDDLLTRLKQHHFLAVLGASGSGKSSLVKAGLLPGLEKGYMGEVGSRWAIAEMRPGDQPFVRLAEGLLADKTFRAAWESPSPVSGNGGESLAGQAPTGDASLSAELRRGSRSLHEILQHAPLPAGTRLLLMVDQFEEMFRFREQQENQAAAFVALLLEACTHPDVYVVITMRSDFLGAAAEFHGLPEAINDGLYLTPRLSREQLRDAISLPAQLFGGAVEDALANHLLNEAGNDPDQLPLLQHALMRL
jgi:energy-coupling factor transporter ATP-binding protein EcfA2